MKLTTRTKNVFANRHPMTAKRATACVNKFVEWAGRDLSVADVTPAMIEQFEREALLLNPAVRRNCAKAVKHVVRG